MAAHPDSSTCKISNQCRVSNLTRLHNRVQPRMTHGALLGAQPPCSNNQVQASPLNTGHLMHNMLGPCTQSRGDALGGPRVPLQGGGVPKSVYTVLGVQAASTINAGPSLCLPFCWSLPHPPPQPNCCASPYLFSLLFLPSCCLPAVPHPPFSLRKETHKHPMKKIRLTCASLRRTSQATSGMLCGGGWRLTQWRH
jgi:hypothetical protein